MAPQDEDEDQETEEDIGAVNAEGYEIERFAKGDRLSLKDAAKVVVADALITVITWFFWKPFLVLLGYANMVQIIVVALVFVDVYLLRKNVKKTSDKIAKKAGGKGQAGGCDKLDVPEHNMY